MTVSLSKAHQVAGVSLKKAGVVSAPSMRVAVCLDVSGSMAPEYQDGHVQNVLTRLLGLGAHFSPNKEIDVFVFDDDASQCRYPATESNYETYVRDHILRDDSVQKWRRTKYANPIHLAYQHYYPDLTHLHDGKSAREHLHALLHHGHHQGGHHLFGGLFGHRKEETPPPPPAIDYGEKDPVLMLFLTDGEADDPSESEIAVHSSAGLPIFWVFVGLAHRSRLLEQFGQEPNGEFIFLPDGARIADDETLYNSLLTPKLVNWLKNRG